MTLENYNVRLNLWLAGAFFPIVLELPDCV